MSTSIRGLRDGALLGVLTYCLGYAAAQLRDVLQPHVANATLRGLFDNIHGLVNDLGMAGVGYFALGGAALGMIPWGNLFGSSPKHKKA